MGALISLLIQVIILPIRLAMSILFTAGNMAANSQRRHRGRRRSGYVRTHQRLGPGAGQTWYGPPRRDYRMSEVEAALLAFLITLGTGLLIGLLVLSLRR